MKTTHWFRSLALLLGNVAPFVLGTVALAADDVTLSYGPVELSVSVTSLETYVNEDKIDAELAVYLDFLSDEERAGLRELLTVPIDVSPFILSRALYSDFGELWLERLGEVIQTDRRQNGFYALRGALVVAAAEPEGLTLLNVMRKFPTPTLRIRSGAILQVVNNVVALVEQTETAIAALKQQSAREVAAAPPIDMDSLPDITQTGPVDWQVEAWELDDAERDRTLIVDLYLPQTQTPAPLVVISHGFGASRVNFADMAQHLASHGFAVAALEHPGSNQRQIQNLFQGTASDVLAPNEFVNRPRDISYVLDRLEAEGRTNSSWASQIDLTRIGAVGHSFGGYTAMALAASGFNVEGLEASCSSDLGELGSVNISLSLQCLALNGDTEQSLQDDRIDAVFVFNPTIALVLGQQELGQVQTPTFIVSGSDDPIAPAAIEQIQPFTWLTTPDKYLALIEGGSHNYEQSDTVPTELSGLDPTLSRQYLKALSLAFMQVHVAGQPDYGQFLQAGYGQQLSQEPLSLKLVQDLPSASPSP